MTCGVSTVVDHLTHNPKIGGSNPTNGEKCIFIVHSSSTVVAHLI
jgi:hypothetical protein